jgi:hypothetical protein
MVATVGLGHGVSTMACQLIGRLNSLILDTFFVIDEANDVGYAWSAQVGAESQSTPDLGWFRAQRFLLNSPYLLSNLHCLIFEMNLKSVSGMRLLTRDDFHGRHSFLLSEKVTTSCVSYCQLVLRSVDGDITYAAEQTGTYQKL